MGKLKIYPEFDADSWNNLDEMVKEAHDNDKEVIYMNSDRRVARQIKTSNFNVVELKDDYRKTKQYRFFCRCGFTSNNKQMNNQCPVCGNKNIITFVRDYYCGDSIDVMKGQKVELGLLDTVNVYQKSYSLSFIKDAAISFKKNPNVLMCELGKDKSIVYSNDIYTDTYDDIIKAYKFDLPKAVIKRRNLYLLSKVINLKKNNKSLYDSIDDFPNLICNLINYNDEAYLKGITLDKIYRNFFYLEPTETEFLKKIDSIDASSYAEPNKNIILFNNIPNKKFVSVIKEIFLHANFSYYESDRFFRRANDFYKKNNYKLKDIEFSEMVYNYIYSNYILDPAEVLYNFTVDCNFLACLGEEINSINLDRRNFNIIKLKHDLEIAGFKNDIIIYFIDMFDDNPVEAMKLLQTKRALNSSQIEEIENKYN